MVGSGSTKGVDADVADKVTDENLEETISKLKAFSKATGSIIAVTGAIDLVCNSEKCYSNKKWQATDEFHYRNRLSAFRTYDSIFSS